MTIGNASSRIRILHTDCLTGLEALKAYENYKVSHVYLDQSIIWWFADTSNDQTLNNQVDINRQI